MAAEWYYVTNQQQAGPVELQGLREMLASGAVSGTDMVFGPGLAEWTRAGQVPALFAARAVTPVGTANPLNAVAGGQTLSYRGAEVGGAELSHTAKDMLRQTKPWARFVAVMMFIGAAFMLVGGGIAMIGGAMMGSGVRGAMPAGLGLVYLAMGALYLAPAVFLNRYASGIQSLMQTNRMSDLERALGAQKSFWKFMGIMMIIVLAGYAVGIGIFVTSRM